MIGVSLREAACQNMRILSEFNELFHHTDDPYLTDAPNLGSSVTGYDMDYGSGTQSYVEMKLCTAFQKRLHWGNRNTASSGPRAIGGHAHQLDLEQQVLCRGLEPTPSSAAASALSLLYLLFLAQGRSTK